MLYLASDHAGFYLKESLKQYLKELNVIFEDCGPFRYNETDDYPDFIVPAAKKVASSEEHRGIVIGGSGQGEAIAANKVKGIRCALVQHYSEQAVKLTRDHNDANMLSLGARFLTIDEAKSAVLVWLQTPFSGEERHCRRLAKLHFIERK